MLDTLWKSSGGRGSHPALQTHRLLLQRHTFFAFHTVKLNMCEAGVSLLGVMTLLIATSVRIEEVPSVNRSLLNKVSIIPFCL
jgi:hypothetical protein